MQPALDWGTGVILWLQQFSPALDLPFRGLTFLGGEGFFLVLLPAIYWCVDRRLGARLILLFLLSAYLNAAAKVLAAQPRPFAYDSRVKALVHAASGGLPSGHTQHTTVVWGYLWASASVRRAFVAVPAAALMVLVPLSRVYLGVHFPTDLLGGYLLGGLLLWVYVRLEPSMEAWFRLRGPIFQGAAAAAVSAALTLAAPSGDPWAMSVAGALWGMGTGFVVERRLVGFGTAGSAGRRLMRFVTGVAVVMLLWSGLRAGFDGLQPETVFRWLRYAALGLWGALGAPWLFCAAGLAERERA